VSVREYDENDASSVDQVQLEEWVVPGDEPLLPCFSWREIGDSPQVQVTSKEDDQMESYQMGRVSIRGPGWGAITNRAWLRRRQRLPFAGSWK